MIRLIWIFLPVLLFSSTIKVDIFNKNKHYAQKATICSKKIYIYDKPFESSHKVLFDFASGVKLDIYSCNKYGWCKLYNNKYVKLYKLKANCIYHASGDIQKRLNEAIYGKFQIKQNKIPKISKTNKKGIVANKNIFLNKQIPQKVKNKIINIKNNIKIIL